MSDTVAIPNSEDPSQGKVVVGISQPLANIQDGISAIGFTFTFLSSPGKAFDQRVKALTEFVRANEVALAAEYNRAIDIARASSMSEIDQLNYAKAHVLRFIGPIGTGVDWSLLGYNAYAKEVMVYENGQLAFNGPGVRDWVAEDLAPLLGTTAITMIGSGLLRALPMAGPWGLALSIVGHAAVAAYAYVSVEMVKDDLAQSIKNIVNNTWSLRGGQNEIVVTGYTQPRKVVLVSEDLANDPSFKAAQAGQGYHPAFEQVKAYLDGNGPVPVYNGLNAIDSRPLPNGGLAVTISDGGYVIQGELNSQQIADFSPATVGDLAKLQSDYGFTLTKSVSYTGAYQISEYLGNVFGSQLGRLLVGDNKIGATVSSAVLGAIGQTIGQAIVVGGLDRPFYLQNGSAVDHHVNGVIGNFSQQLASQLRSSAVGAVSSFLALELGNALGVQGFGSELLVGGVGSVMGQVINNAATIAAGSGANVANNLFHGLDGRSLFGSVNSDSGLISGGLLSGTIGSFFGSKLGSLILAPSNSEGAVLSSIGASAGVWALTSGAASLGIGGFAAGVTSAFGVLANVAVPFVGSLVGFLVGSFIGGLFGKKKPRTPTAAAETYLNFSSGYWDAGAVSAANGGSIPLVTHMAQTSLSSINHILGIMSGGAEKVDIANDVGERHRYGHSGTTIYFDELVGSQWIRRYSGANADVAAETGALAGIRSTEVVGGDIFLKRAIYGSSARSITEMLGNMQIANDYLLYLSNPQPINELIASHPNSAFAASWIITLLRAEELGLTRYQASDFFGGMRGFAQSFGYGAGGFGYENLVISQEGAGARIATRDGADHFQMLAGANNLTGAAAAKSAFIANFGWQQGFTNWSGQATTGNDFYVASGASHGVVIDDQAMIWVPIHNPDPWNPYPQLPTFPIEGDNGYYEYVSGGDDVFIGSNFDDYLYGQAGDDWLDGGQGNDHLEGGIGNDVLLGGGGVDHILGGAGDDYLAGGDGNDYVQSWIAGPAPGGLFGGAGNDILVGGAGVDALFGEEGNDTFIVDQDNGAEWDYFDGGAGNDTVSFERFTLGISIDMRTGAGDGYVTRTYGDGWVSIENMTGSNHADYMVGDAQSNVLKGLNGNDTIHGLEGDDTIEGGRGADTMYGGSGVNTLSYAGSTAAVVVDLATGAAFGGDAEGDIFYEFANVRGSDYGDTLTGDAGSNTLDGGKGNDVFFWSAGYDVIQGGTGFDTFNASRATSGITLHAGGYAYVGGVYTYLNSVEGYVGTRWADSFTGSAANERFEGGAGNDWLSGGDGSDAYVFGFGDGYDTVAETHDGHNVIELKSGVNFRDVAIAGAGGYGNLTVTLRPTGEYITVGQNFAYGADGAHNHKIKTLDFAGFSAVDISGIDWVPANAETDAGTYIYGGQSKSDLIFAYGGNDVIYGAGSYSAWENRGNVIYAGDGDDAIYTSSGDDIFLFERGNGRDFIHDTGGVDTIVMGPSVSADDVIIEVKVRMADSFGGQVSDLYIGIRDLTNPGLTASQVADHIVISEGGTVYYDLTYGTQTFNSLEHIRVGGREIDLSKAGINFTTSYIQSYVGGGWDPWNPGGGGHIPPLAIDLDGDGIELTSVEGSRITTLDADGNLFRMGWLSGDDGFLALDRDGNGVIDNLSEIQFVQDLEGAKTDLEGLVAFDSNGDGRLDASDARWSEFRIWQDKNQDGVGRANELMSLDKAGIKSISLQGSLTGFSVTDGIDNTVIATTAIEWTDPSRTGLGYDVALATRQVRTDGGDLALAEKALGKGKADAIDALLFGSQPMGRERAEQAKLARTEKARGANKVANPQAGQLGRIEEFISDAKKGVNGLLNAQGRRAFKADKKSADLANRPTFVEGVAESAQSPLTNPQIGSFVSVNDLSSAEFARQLELTPHVHHARLENVEQIGNSAGFAFIEDLTKDSERSADVHSIENPARGQSGLAAAMAHFEAMSRAIAPGLDLSKEATAPAHPPSAAEMARNAAKDTFRYLPADVAENIAPSDGGWLSTQSGQAGGDREAPMASQERGVPTQQQPERRKSDHARASVPQSVPAASGQNGDQSERDYEGIAAVSHARLIQAMSGFGAKQSMFSDYRYGSDGSGGAGQDNWLTVDRQISLRALPQLI